MAVDEPVGGRQRHLQSAADVLVRPARPVPQHEGEAAAGGQRAEHPPQLQPQDDPVLGVEAPLRQDPSDVGALGGGQAILAPVLAPGAVGDGSPAGDLLQPGDEWAPAFLVGPDQVEGPQEDLGGDVVDVGGVGLETVSDDAEDDVLVPAVELAERLAVAGLGALDEGGLVEVGDVGRGRGCGDRGWKRYAQLDPPLGLCCRAGAWRQGARWRCWVRGGLQPAPGRSTSWSGH
jgi:hypothetical protein